MDSNFGFFDSQAKSTRDRCRRSTMAQHRPMSMVQMIGVERCRVKNYEQRRARVPRPLDKSLVIYDYRHRRYTVIRSYSRFICYPAEGTIGR